MAKRDSDIQGAMLNVDQRIEYALNEGNEITYNLIGLGLR